MASNSVEYVITLKDFFTAPLGNMVKEVDKADKKVNDFASSITSMGIGFLGAMGLKSVASDVLEVGASYEMLQLRFNNMTGSVEEGTRVFERIKKEAEITPFSVESLGDATAGFMAANVSADDARTTIMDLGNAIAFAGKTGVEFDRVALNLQQIKGKGDASAQDMKEFGTAGINMWKALELSTGKHREELEKGTITYEMLTNALHVANTETGLFANGLATVGGSTKIAMSNVSDGLNNFYNDIFTLLKPSIDTVIHGIQDLLLMGRDFVAWISDNKEGLKAIASGLLVVASAYTIMSAGAMIAGIQIGGVTVAMIAQSIATFGLAETWAMLNLTMSANPIGLIVVGLGALTAGIVYAWNKFEGFRGFVMGLWGVIKQFGATLLEVGKAFLNFQMGDFSGATANLKNAWELGKGMGDAYAKGQKEGIESFVKDSKTEIASKTVGKSTLNSTSLIAQQKQAKQSANSVKGNEVKNITVNIGKLVEGLVIKVNDSKEVAPKLRDEIVKVLLSAVNDVNVIGG